jgi:hypothetical protein
LLSLSARRRRIEHSVASRIGIGCKICKHAERAAIDVGLAEHRSINGMSKRFGVSIWSLHRHRQRHMPKALITRLMSGSAYEVENLDELKSRESERLLSNAVEVRSRLYNNAEAAERVGDFSAATKSYAVIIHSLELIGKLLDSFHGREKQTINQLVISPDYLRLRAALIQALASYPDARKAVAAVVRDLETAEVTSTADIPKETRVLKTSKEVAANGAGT